MQLNYKKIGSGYPLIILHGLYGASDNWLSVAKHLASDFEVYIIDQRNHGLSPHTESHNYENMKEDLNDFMLQQNINKAIIIGHSMGGKTAMAFAQDYEHKVASMLIVDIAPKDYNECLYTKSNELNHRYIINSILDLDLAIYKTRTDIDIALSDKLKDVRIRQFILKNLKRVDKKAFAWKLNIKTISKYLDDIMQNIKFKQSIIGFPILFIKGGNSDYIGEDDMHCIAKFFPEAQINTIANAGHWVHAEQEEMLVKTIKYFISDK